MSAQQPPAEPELRSRTLRHIQPIVTELRQASFDSLPWRIADGETIGSTDAQLAKLAKLATAYSQHRESQSSLPTGNSRRAGCARPSENLLLIAFNALWIRA